MISISKPQLLEELLQEYSSGAAGRPTAAFSTTSSHRRSSARATETGGTTLAAMPTGTRQTQVLARDRCSLTRVAAFRQTAKRRSRPAGQPKRRYACVIHIGISININLRNRSRCIGRCDTSSPNTKPCGSHGSLGTARARRYSCANPAVSNRNRNHSPCS